MLRIEEKLPLSPYSQLYDILLTKDDKYRKIDDLIDFSFIRQELESKYSPNMGRNAIDPIILFKYIIVKAEEDISDVDLVERSRTDLSIKRFLGYMPEDEVIDSSTLTVFRRTRLKDVDLLKMLLGKTVEIAQSKGLLLSKTILVDSTHTSSLYCTRKPITALSKRLSDLLKAANTIKPTIKEKISMPELPSDINEAIAISEKVKKQIDEELSNIPEIIRRRLKVKSNILVETIEDIKDHYYISEDRDARVGHKSANTSFNGYKTHIAMTTDRIITGAVVTTGEKCDGEYLDDLIEMTKENGVDVDTAIGDGAYGSTENYEYADGNFKLLAKENKRYKRLLSVPIKGGFTYNKDADRLVCPKGHMAVEKVDKPTKAGLYQTNFYFDNDICQACELKRTCLALANERKTTKGAYKVPKREKPKIIWCKSPKRIQRSIEQQSDEFKKAYSVRYMIEAKNAELKQNHHYGKTISKGITGMNIQSAVSLCVVNIKRILTLTSNNTIK